MLSAVETQPHINPWIVATAVMFATFMEVLDTTVVNVSCRISREASGQR